MPGFVMHPAAGLMKMGRKTKEQARGGGAGALSCPHCAKRFISKSKMERHLVVHTKEKPYVKRGREKKGKMNLAQEEKRQNKSWVWVSFLISFAYLYMGVGAWYVKTRATESNRPLMGYYIIISVS